MDPQLHVYVCMQDYSAPTTWAPAGHEVNPVKFVSIRGSGWGVYPWYISGLGTFMFVRCTTPTYWKCDFELIRTSRSPSMNTNQTIPPSKQQISKRSPEHPRRISAAAAGDTLLSDYTETVQQDITRSVPIAILCLKLLS